MARLTVSVCFMHAQGCVDARDGLNSADKRLIRSKIKVLVYIIYACVLSLFIYIQVHTHTVYILLYFILYIHIFNA